MTKQLFIVYDKDWAECATTLYNLLSSQTDIKASIFTVKEMKQLVSREKCLYIGKDCTKSLQFDDTFDRHGIHIGMMGAKAWIRCVRYEWDASLLASFEDDLMNYAGLYGMEKTIKERYENDKVYIRRQFVHCIEPYKGNPLKLAFDENLQNKGWNRVGDYVAMLKIGPISFNKLVKMESLLSGGSLIRKYQYLLGVMIFHEKFLKDFLGLDNAEEEKERDASASDNEKKN